MNRCETAISQSGEEADHYPLPAILARRAVRAKQGTKSTSGYGTGDLPLSDVSILYATHGPRIMSLSLLIMPYTIR